ncbi:MAG: class I SAM-dependent methyltransferase [Planctomycetales bacterium]|nr:class I SAM-dependent methyltransferase [Planctomycetales bacterium]
MTTNTAPAKSANQCWVCNSEHVRHWKPASLDRPLTPEDLRITDSRYGLTAELWKCESCGFIFADDAAVSDLVELYSQLTDDDYVDSSPARALQMRWLMDKATSMRPQAASMLDIGAGTGLLVAEGAARGLRAVGVEPSASLVACGREQYAVELLQGTYPHEQLAGQKFDIVFLVDVIEHVSNPVELLQSCANALNLGGLFVVVTPDAGSMAARMLKDRWWHYRLAHVGYFDRDSMTAAARTAGLKPEVFKRARWFFPLGYVADRLGEYLPLKTLNRLARATPGVRRLYEMTVPVNPHDSWVVFMSLDDQTLEDQTLDAQTLDDQSPTS